MSAALSYQSIAQEYATGVRALLAPPSAATADRDRGGSPKASSASLVSEAEKLAPVSVSLTVAAAAKFTDEDPAVRATASTQLLAKALTDLQISAYLLQAAEDEELGLKSAVADRKDRSVAPAGLEENLNILLSSAPTGRPVSPQPADDRAAATPLDVPAARAQLKQAAEDALDLIQTQAAKTGQAALSGVSLS